jgi:hypothetical protein
MKIKLLNILGVMLLGMMIMFSSCEEKDDYDYNSIEPEVQGIVGPEEVRGSQIFDYRAYGRGGSTYEFVTTGAIDSFTPIEGEAYGISVDFEESYDDATAEITVVETTMGGKVSEPYVIDILITKLRIGITGNEEVSVQPEQVVQEEYVPDFLNYPGATYEWTVTGDWASISSGGNEAKVVVDYIYPDVPLDSIFIELNVTTRRNNVITQEMMVYVKQFCPLIVEDMEGEWISTVTLDGENFQMASATVNEDHEYGLNLTGFLDFLVVDAWGENWVEGDGTVVISFNEPDGTVNLPLQWIGQSDYPDNYWVEGILEGAEFPGSYDFCVPRFTVSWQAYYGGEVGEDGLPVDPDALTAIFTTTVTGTFTEVEGKWMFKPDMPQVIQK